jgi:hypothetical protein
MIMAKIFPLLIMPCLAAWMVRYMVPRLHRCLVKYPDIPFYLWAVGLAGAAISATVNELAGPFLGNFLFMIVAIVLLVFGHGLNMILNVLSVIVHGIRLNTLEFSSHLDMSWSGHKFKPFEEQIEN